MVDAAEQISRLLVPRGQTQKMLDAASRSYKIKDIKIEDKVKFDRIHLQ